MPKVADLEQRQCHRKQQISCCSRNFMHEINSSYAFDFVRQITATNHLHFMPSLMLI